MKVWIIAIAAIIALLAVGIMIVSWWLDRPLYVPGSVASRVDLKAPEKETPTYNTGR